MSKRDQRRTCFGTAAPSYPTLAEFHLDRRAFLGGLGLVALGVGAACGPEGSFITIGSSATDGGADAGGSVGPVGGGAPAPDTGVPDPPDAGEPDAGQALAGEAEVPDSGVPDPPDAGEPAEPDAGETWDAGEPPLGGGAPPPNSGQP